MSNKRTLLFVLFTISGFSGLIYESIWTHYLKLFLGHAAYAQTLVLAIFMGGLSLGSILSSRYSPSRRNLLRYYAAAEAAVGLFALAFHPVFNGIVEFSHSTIIPSFHSSAAAYAYKWAVSALMILPQSILLGMTFPLMSGALLRRFPGLPGSSIAMLYFTNSIGAAVGVLASGFFLVRLTGLPGTMIIAGCINIILALVVYRIADEEPAVQPSSPDVISAKTHPVWLLLFASFLTGAASFMYEVGWIRMLSLVLGTSNHAFELMLSAFIFGLAFGGLWIQKRIDSMEDPVRMLVIVQMAMGALALATLPLYGSSFSVMQKIVASLPKTESGYLLFNISSNLLALAIMLPATFCAGMTLPLITVALIRRGHGESSIGQVYAVNTIGAIVGVFFAIHVGMPFLGLKGVITTGALLDMGLGVLVLLLVYKGAMTGPVTAVASACLCITAVSLFSVTLDPLKMASGVFRRGDLLDRSSEVVFYQDGKTASVSVVKQKEGNTNFLSIRTNGKPDASLNIDTPHLPRPDETTMVLAGALPLAYHENARTVANIGFGSGLTSHTLLTDPRIAELDTIEIEPQMVEGARQFGPQVELVYRDLRSRIFIDDAKTFFSVHNKKYDIIISEPSNPWVSGVSGLFSEEFYRLVNRHLNEKGLFVQWIQLYEIDLGLVASVFKALDRTFADFVVYTANYGDLLVIAKNEKGFASGPSSRVFEAPRLASQLRQIDITGIDDIETRKIGNRKSLMPFFSTYPLRANSDYFPVLDQNAARARFLGVTAQDLVKLAIEPLPIVDMLAPHGSSNSITNIALSSYHPKTKIVNTAMALRDYCLTGAFPRNAAVDAETREYAARFRKIFNDCRGTEDPNRRVYLFNTAKTMFPYLSPDESKRVWSRLESSSCTSRMAPAEKAYVTLFKAIGERDGGKMRDASRYLLENEHDITPARLKFVVSTGMLGSLSQGNRPEAAELWNIYRTRTGGREPQNFLHHFLNAQVSDAAVKQQR